MYFSLIKLFILGPMFSKAASFVQTETTVNVEKP